ncbi:MAG: hypothetical protein AB1483_04920 [Candidatus Zixiibacteriota bacterium]
MVGLRVLSRVGGDRGISLIEVVALIVIVAIVAATALKSMRPGMENARKRKTEREMEMIMKGIIGDPSVMSVAGGVRSDFGYVGDVGAFPPNLDALVENPGGYTTWNGPYIPSQYMDGYKIDEWGQEYIYDGALSLTTGGSSSQFRRHGSLDTTDILHNTLAGFVVDANDNPPGSDYADSIEVTITYPNGSGGLAANTANPDSTGHFSFSSIVMGQHLVEAVYLPEVDTLVRYVTVLPRHNEDEHIRMNFGSVYFAEDTSGGGGEGHLTLVDGTPLASGTGCRDVSFDIINNTGSDVTVTTIYAAWSGSAAYYEIIRWNSTQVFSSGSTRIGTEQTVDISDQTIANGATATVTIQGFKDRATGSGNSVNMGGKEFQIAFSDGSQVEFTTPSCP